MKKIFTIFASLLFAGAALAQSPGKMSYQAVIRDAGSHLVVNHAVGMKFTILQGSASGSPVYSEIYTTNTNENGLVTIEIGGGPGFYSIDWAMGPYFLKTETDPTGGSSYTISGTSQLLSVPYALHAKTAESAAYASSEFDPVFASSLASSITLSKLNNWNLAFLWGNHATAGYLTSFTETDPIFGASPAKGITSTQVTNWNSAFGWGNHATAGYLNSFTETDPIFGASPAKGITSTQVTNWNSAFGWGNHANAGYLTSLSEVDPIFLASPANGITGTQVTNWENAFGWGNHASAGYLTTFTETDPIYSAWDKSTGISITASQVTDFQTSVTNNADVMANTAKNSFPPAAAIKLSGIEELAEVNVNADWNVNSGDAEILNKPTTVAGYGITDAMTTAHDANAVTAANIADWSTAFGWGDHETAGYLKNTSETVAGDLMFYDGAVWVSKRLLLSNTGSYQPVNNMQPFLTVNYCIAIWGIYPSRSGLDAFIGAIEINAFNFAPKGYLTCDGQILSIASNVALFSLLGTQYGGDGITTFALPDLRGRVAIHQGYGFGLSPRTIGEAGGAETFTLTTGNLPAHSHVVVYE